MEITVKMTEGEYKDFMEHKEKETRLQKRFNNLRTSAICLVRNLLDAVEEPALQSADIKADSNICIGDVQALKRAMDVAHELDQSRFNY